MTFYERFDAVVAVLRRRGRVSCRALKRELDLDDALLDDLKAELVDVQGLAREENGRVLVWIGGGDAERRQVTVMFCDLVASTELSARLDPEELRDILRGYQDVADEVVRGLGGVIARYVGDGLLIYFGYPHAHEDDPQRAVRAGLGIVAAVGDLHRRLSSTIAALRHIPLRVRIGLHTGVAVMGSMGDSVHRDDMAAVGDTPAIAARIQGLADPDAVLVTEATYRLLRSAFECEALGPRPLKGITDPVRVYRVVGEQEPSEASAPIQLSPLVGREQEFGLLVDRWTRVQEGVGQVVLLTGEAGIGKSRLVHALESHVAAGPHLRLKARGSPYHQDSALYPLTELLQRTLGIDRRQSAEERLACLEQSLREDGFAPADAVPFLAPLLSLPLPDERHPSPALSPERHRERTLETLLTFVLELAARQPVLLIVEDLQWVDASTLEWLGLLIERAPTARLLALVTARPDFALPSMGPTPLTPLVLGRLPRAQIERLIAAVADGKTLPAPVVEQVATKTDGVPLFVEELTKMVIESGWLREHRDRYELDGPLPPLAIPATLQDSLMARLDRLATVKAVVQIGATIGRTFSYALLRAVSGADDETLRRDLGKLVDAELLYQRGVPPASTYTFKHALIQDAAYQALLRSTRQQYHARNAQVLAERFPETVAAEPELLAYHYTEAGLSAAAIPHWRSAGEHALQRGANVEAIGHLRRGLALIDGLPDSPERGRAELALQLLLGPALMRTKGDAAPEAGQAYARARALSRHVEDPSQRASILWGLWNFYLTAGDLPTGRELAELLLILAEATEDETSLIEARRALGITEFYLGDVSAARTHLEQGIALYDAPNRRAHAPADDDPGMACRSFLACALWLHGYPDQALERVRETVALARESSQPSRLVFALHYAALVRHLRRDGSACDEMVKELIGLAREHGFAQRLATGMIQAGWSRVEQGATIDGIAELRDGLATYRGTGAALGRPFFLSMLAEAYGKIGRTDDALAALSEATAAMEDHDERWWEPELHRIHGVLIDSEACLRRALDVARRQGARSLELRAATSLARLRQPAGVSEDARRLLAEIYARFTEGFETADLRDARAVLAATS